MENRKLQPIAKRMAARDLVSPDVLRQIQKRSDAIAFGLIFHAWGMILAAMAMFAIWPNPVTFVVAVMIIGARQLGLAILLHDAAHNALFKTASFNNILSDIFCGWPQMARTDTYRRYHLQHHFHAQQADDPDLVLSAPFPITAKSLRRKLTRDLTGQTGYKQRKAQIISAFGSRDLSLGQRLAHFWANQGPALLANLVILAICSTLFHWSYYGMFWVLPLMTFNMAVTRLRNIAEHALVPDNNDPLRNARTTRVGPLGRIFLAPYWVNYHVEHHLLMHVPCYRLVTLHKAMLAAGFGPKMEIADSYIEVLRQACSKPNDQDGPGETTNNGRRRVSGSFSDGFAGPPTA
jgi:fatty acid desaturase